MAFLGGGAPAESSLGRKEKDELDRLRVMKNKWDMLEKAAKAHHKGAMQAQPEFLNAFLAGLWPRVSKYVNTIIVKEVQPKLQEKLPGPLKSTFRFDEKNCNLGTKPIQFPSMFVDGDEEAFPGGVKQNLTLRSVIEWASDMSVILKLGGVPVGLSNLLINGQLHIEFVGLLDEPPFFEGIRVFFTSVPELSVDFRGALAGFNIDTIKNKILDAIGDGIRGALVLPNRIGLPLAATADIFDLKSPAPEGVLKLVVHSAADLAAKDSAGIFSRASSDPYAVVSLGPETHQSQTINKNLNPKFDYKVDLVVADKESQKVKIKFWDDDLNFVDKDDYLGGAKATVLDIIGWGGQQQVIRLHDVEREDGKCATVTVSGLWRPLLLTDDGGDDCAHVFAGVYSVSQIKCAEDTDCWFTVTYNDGGKPQEKQSKKIKPKATPTSDLQAMADREAKERKIVSMREYKMPDAQIAKVLDIEEDEVEQMAKKAVVKTKKHTFEFEEGYHFTTESGSKTTLTFEFHLGGKKPHVLGKVMRSADDIRKAKGSTLIEELKLDSGEIVKIRATLRYLGQPTGSPRRLK
jgi:hypothetical protein